MLRPLLPLGVMLCAACGSSGVPPQPPGTPPKAETVTVAEPGGNAHDPHFAALDRQVHEPWGERNDKDNQLLVPLPDAPKWKRVRYFGVEHFLGFRYGDDHHVLALAFVHDAEPGAAVDSRSCIRRFESWARAQSKAFGPKLEAIGERNSKWRDQPLSIHFVDGYADVAFSRREFSAAWAAYPAYPDACLIFAVAVPWRDQPEAARKLRDRFLTEAFERVNPLTPVKAVRK
ncbi:MAG: hypothetical protein IT377_18340 [Polyangiaceae bacterium]|nr:hypothetical protein [Polyangiaceae bacterium]